MDFGVNAFQMASHVTLVATLALVGARVMRAFHDRALMARAEDAGFSAALATLFLALGIESAFYLVARALKAEGPDLWAAHPAPEVLRLLVVWAVFALSLPILRARGLGGRALLRRVAVELGALAGLWLLLAEWLR